MLVVEYVQQASSIFSVYLDRSLADVRVTIAFHLIVDSMILGVDLLRELVEYELGIVDRFAYDVNDAYAVFLGKKNSVRGAQTRANNKQWIFLKPR